MSTIEAKLTYLNDTKNLIKDALIAKGATINSNTPYRDYATTIENLSSGSVFTPEWSQGYYDSVYATSLVTPTEWLPIPELTETDQKVHILIAVYDCSSNFTAFTCSGNYTVDWGDGVIENFTAGTKAEHTYNYSNTSLNSDTVSKYGYKQCLLTITPQSGQTFTSLDFDQYHNSIGSGMNYDMTQPFVAMSIAGQSISSLILSQTKTYVNFNVLKYFRLQKNNITNMTNIFNSCYSLTTIPLLNTSSVTSMNDMFNSCYSLTTIPLLNTSSVTNMTNIFNGCRSLTTIPLLNTSLVTSMNGMFYSCYSLTTIPLLDTSLVTSMNDMFNSCYSLTTIPLLDTSLVTSISFMFYSCYSLTTIPLLNTSSVTNMTNIFNGCYSLTTIPLLNTSLVTSMASMFYSCRSLTTIPLLDTSLVTSMANMFNSCINLKRIQSPIRFTTILSNSKLSSTELNEIYTNLPTKTGQTLTVTGNWGTATDNPTIATAKGWTITG